MKGKEQSNNKTLEDFKSFFTNPKSADSEQFALLTADTIRAMAEIYAAGGDVSKMSETAREWLYGDKNGQSNVRDVVGKLLAKEGKTRLFDHRFMGQIHPQGNEVAIIANMVAAYMNTNTIVKEVSPAENQMEKESLQWLAETFGYDTRTFSGNLVSGGTTANLAALWVAREKKISELQEQKRWQRGKILYVLGTEMAHYSVCKSCDLLGKDIVFIKTPIKDFKTDVMEMGKVIKAVKSHGNEIMAIVGLAGETETGMVDNLSDLADLAEQEGIYFHIDAAYGGPFVLSSAGGLFKGIDRADSITVDPHKMLYTPYPAGAVLFKDKRNHMLVEKGMRQKARYLLSNETRMSITDDNENRNFGMSRPEGSMSAAGVISTWATIQLFGKEGIATLLNHTLYLADVAYLRVKGSSVVRPLHSPETNAFLVGLKDFGLDRDTHRKVMRIARDKLDAQGYYISLNEDVDQAYGDKRPAYRFVAMHPHTDNEDVYELFDKLESEIYDQVGKNESARITR